MSISRAGWQNGSQEAAGGSFWAFLGLIGKMALRRFLGGSFGAFLGLASKMALVGPLGIHFRHFQG